jgi:tetratricopeptide (TPR) repeat protein
MRTLSLLLLSLALALGAVPAAGPDGAYAQAPSDSAPADSAAAGYGATDFPTSGADDAQKPFLRGLLMLHSFEYVSARSAFQEAQRRDPDFAMAHWGEAMTHNHPVWMEQDREAALGALRDLGETCEARLDAAPTAREQEYLKTTHVLYGACADDPAGKEARDDAYREAMADLAAQYPEDLDARAFYALSILGTAHEGRDFAVYMQAAAEAEAVFDANPEHPGAAHYLIHAYDDPVHAPLGLRPARVYADIAPGASHALHMPSHIFFALGMWERGAASNVDSYRAAARTTERRGEPLNGHGYHALHWLAYARAQQGQYDEARSVVETALAHADSTEGDRGYEGFITSTYLAAHVVETGRWDALDRLVPDTTGLSPRAGATLHAARGMAALERDDRAAAEAALGAARQHAAAGDDELQLPVLQLEGLLRLDAGKTDAALDALRRAAEREGEMPLDFGPPWPVKPSHELLGDVLLRLERPAEAQRQYEAALERYPGRALSTWGRARAAAAAGHAEAAREARSALAAMWDDADPPVRRRLDALGATASSR